MSNRFHFLIQVTHLVNLRLRDDIPNGILCLCIEGIPLQRNECDAVSIDGIKRLNSQCIRPETESGCTLEVHINDAILEGLKCTILDGHTALPISSQIEVLNRRSSHNRALIRELDHALASCVILILDMEFKVIAALHNVTQINRVPDVLICFLRVTGNPVERNSR